MQLIPKWAKKDGFDPYDLRQNIEGGIFEFAKLMKKYGNEEEALIAYNWGQGNWDAYKKSGKGYYGQARPEESLNYVKAVYSHVRGGPMLLPGEAAKFKRQIDNERKRREWEKERALAGAKEDVRMRLKDGIAALEDGKEAELPSENELRLVFGNKLPEVARRIDIAREFGADVRELPSLSAEGQLELLDKRRPEPGEGYAARAKYHDRLALMIDQDQRQRHNDEVAYLAKHDSQFAQARQNLLMQENPDPKVATAYMAELAAARQRRGMAGDALLSKSDSLFFASLLNKSDNPQQAAAKISGLFGPGAPEAMTQIFKKSAPLVMLAANMDARNAEAGKTLLAAARDPKFLEAGKTLLKQKGNDYKELQDKIYEHMKDFLSSVLAAGDATLADAAIDAGCQLALAHMMKNGLSLSEAAELAGDEIAMDRYAFWKNGNDTVFRAPKNAASEDIIHGAKLTLQNLKAEDINLAAIPGMYDKNIAEDRLMAQIRREAHWVTDGDEGGLVLFWGNAALLDRQGRVFRRSWQKLAEYGGPRSARAVLADIDINDPDVFEAARQAAQ